MPYDVAMETTRKNRLLSIYTRLCARFAALPSAREYDARRRVLERRRGKVASALCG